MVFITENELYDQMTGNRQFAYMLTAKHHDGKDRDAARWLPDLTRAEEFSVFDMADIHDVSDGDGHLYGVLRSESAKIRFVGTRRQQISKFWNPQQEGHPWHGFPLWPIDENSTARLKKSPKRDRPPREILQLMLEKDLISKLQQKRLIKGDHA